MFLPSAGFRNCLEYSWQLIQREHYRIALDFSTHFLAKILRQLTNINYISFI